MIRFFSRKSQIVTASIALALLAVGFLSFRPEEGMFPLNYLNVNELKNAGLKLEGSDIFNPGNVSLTDALVKVGGCTGSFISEDGLVITNHHCVYGSVANLSDSNHNYLENGFVAKERKDELSIPMPIKITQSYEDVSTRVLNGVTDETAPDVRAAKISENIRSIVEQENKLHPEFSNEISEMFVGKSYTLFRYIFIKDVRLVLAPPLTIGQFGGDRDNWEWPRHNGDFSLVRAYVGPDGKPAAYSEKNIPYKPKNTLKINPNGTNAGDFVFIMGYPGRTFRHESGAYMKFQKEKQLPIIQEWYKQYIDYMKEYSEGNTNMRLAFAGEIQSLENVEKNYRGKIQGLRRTDIVDHRLTEDQQILNHFKANSAEFAQAQNVIPQINNIWQERSKLALFQFTANRFLLSQSAAAEMSYWIKGAALNPGLLNNQSDAFKTAFKKDFPTGYSFISREMEMKVFEDLVVRTFNAWNGLSKPVTTSKYLIKNAAGKWVITDKTKKALKKSIYFDTAKTNDQIRGNWLKLARSNDVVNGIMDEILPTASMVNAAWGAMELKLKSLMPQYIGLREKYLQSRFIPDANSTLRLTYGYIRSYSPNDGEIHSPYTTLDGVFAKANTNSDYRLPQEFQDNLRQENIPAMFKDPVTGKVIVGILYNLDTTGGNSGSPVLNAKGELIAINFDRSFTATINDYAWNENYSRSIGCDIRYVLYVIKYVGKADHILKELNINI